MSATIFQMDLLTHIRRYGPITAECIAYDFDEGSEDLEFIQRELVIMRALKWIEGNKTGGYVISERFQWLRDIE